MVEGRALVLQNSGTRAEGAKSPFRRRCSTRFEGGQLPLQMRIPKFGFRSRIGLATAEVRLSELKAEGDTINLASLKANVVRRDMKRVRIMLSGEVTSALKVEDVNVAVTKGARAAIEAAGGQVIDIEAPVKGRLVKKEKTAETAEC